MVASKGLNTLHVYINTMGMRKHKSTALEGSCTAAVHIVAYRKDKKRDKEKDVAEKEPSNPAGSLIWMSQLFIRSKSVFTVLDLGQPMILFISDESLSALSNS